MRTEVTTGAALLMLIIPMKNRMVSAFTARYGLTEFSRKESI
jgi:hypothetical protein